MEFAEIPEVVIDLSRSGTERWEPLKPYREVIGRLVRFALADVGIESDRSDPVSRLTKNVSFELIQEDLEGLARATQVPQEQLLAANLYYDSLKTLWACTAFAVDTPRGPLHARNLDWVADTLHMSEASLNIRFRNGDRPDREFVSVGWPGMVGVLSGIAPGRFSVSLNAVVSEEPVARGVPVVFLLRHVLEHAADFDEAVAILEAETICSDCILLLAGTRPGEMAIVERSPTAASVIRPTDGALLAANHYQRLSIPDAQLIKPEDERERTTHGRHERIAELLAAEHPQSFDACIDLLRDPAVMMEMTVQQMAFHPARGTYSACLIKGR